MCLLLLFTFLLLFHFDILLSTWLLLIFCLFHLSFSLLCNDWTLAAVSSRECRFVDSPHFSVEERRSKLTFWVLLNFNENWLFFFALLKQILLGKFLHGFVEIRKLCYFFFCFNFFLLGSLLLCRVSFRLLIHFVCRFFGSHFHVRLLGLFWLFIGRSNFSCSLYFKLDLRFGLINSVFNSFFVRIINFPDKKIAQFKFLTTLKQTAS